MPGPSLLDLTTSDASCYLLSKAGHQRPFFKRKPISRDGGSLFRDPSNTQVHESYKSEPSGSENFCGGRWGPEGGSLRALRVPGVLLVLPAYFSSAVALSISLATPSIVRARTSTLPATLPHSRCSIASRT